MCGIAQEVCDNAHAFICFRRSNALCFNILQLWHVFCIYIYICVKTQMQFLIIFFINARKYFVHATCSMVA